MSRKIWAAVGIFAAYLIVLPYAVLDPANDLVWAAASLLSGFAVAALSFVVFMAS